MSYFFFNILNSHEEADMWSIFRRWGQVRDLYIARKRTKQDRRYGFVRFTRVDDVKGLERKLDNIFIDSRKLFINLQKYERRVNSQRSIMHHKQLNIMLDWIPQPRLA